MDYTSTDIDHPKLIKVGRKGQRLLASCGDLFSPWLPEDKQIPPDDADPDWHADRALWRWKPNQNLQNGGKQFLCPQCAGKVATNAKTRRPQTPQQRRAFPFHRRRILLSRFSQRQPGATGFLPTHPLRHPRLETKLRPSQHHREIQRHAQRQRRIGRRVVPGFRSRRSHHRSIGPSRSPQPKGTQKGTQTPPQPPKTQRHRPRVFAQRNRHPLYHRGQPFHHPVNPRPALKDNPLTQ